MTYCNVVAVPWEFGYELYVEGVGVTQAYCHSKSKVCAKQSIDRMVRDLLEIEFGDLDADKCEVRVTYAQKPPEDLEDFLLPD